MTTATGKLRKREQAIAALLTSPTIQDAARSCGVTARTLQRWLAEPEFQSQYRSTKSQLLEGTVNKLRSIGIDGVTALHRIAVDKESPAGATVSAGRAILEVLLRAVEVKDLDARITELERLVERGDR